jgi:demethylmenaquinone methyltransferase / 2-methoxy-6-polyprenyl-1,4-benzoquinol methylase
MFCRIARRYDLANRLLSGGVDIWWRYRLVSAVKRSPAGEILDLATGSGDVAFALSRHLPNSRIVGVDFCQPMLDEAESKKAGSHRPSFANVSFRQGDGLALPFADESFHAVTISFGLRNMGDRHRCLTEMRRVLKENGRIFVLEFSQPQRWFRPCYLFYLRKILPFLAGALTGDRSAYVYLNETIERFPNAAGLTAELQSAGFRQIGAQPLSFGIVALHEGLK